LTATETIVGILEEIFTNTDCHAFDLAERFGEEQTPTEVIGRDERVVRIGTFGMFELESLSDEFGFGTFTSKKFEQ
jgi:hypothetical protein